MVDRSDDFNRANGGLGSNWTTTLNAFNIASNVIVGTAAGDQNSACWSADNFASNQYSQVKLDNLSDGGGPSVRSTTVISGTFYTFFVQDAATATIYEVTAGSFAALGAAFNPSAAVGDIAKLGVVGSTLTAYINDSSITTRTDATITSGKPGVHSTGTAATFDDWLGGPLPEPAAKRLRELAVKRQLRRRRIP